MNIDHTVIISITLLLIIFEGDPDLHSVFMESISKTSMEQKAQQDIGQLKARLKALESDNKYLWSCTRILRKSPAFPCTKPKAIKDHE